MTSAMMTMDATTEARRGTSDSMLLHEQMILAAADDLSDGDSSESDSDEEEDSDDEENSESEGEDEEESTTTGYSASDHLSAATSTTGWSGRTIGSQSTIGSSSNLTETKRRGNRRSDCRRNGEQQQPQNMRRSNSTSSLMGNDGGGHRPTLGGGGSQHQRWSYKNLMATLQQEAEGQLAQVVNSLGTGPSLEEEEKEEDVAKRRRRRRSRSAARRLVAATAMATTTTTRAAGKSGGRNRSKSRERLPSRSQSRESLKSRSKSGDSLRSRSKSRDSLRSRSRDSLRSRSKDSLRSKESNHCRRSGCSRSNSFSGSFAGVGAEEGDRQRRKNASTNAPPKQFRSFDDAVGGGTGSSRNLDDDNKQPSRRERKKEAALQRSHSVGTIGGADEDDEEEGQPLAARRSDHQRGRGRRSRTKSPKSKLHAAAAEAADNSSSSDDHPNTKSKPPQMPRRRPRSRSLKRLEEMKKADRIAAGSKSSGATPSISSGSISSLTDCTPRTNLSGDYSLASSHHKELMRRCYSGSRLSDIPFRGNAALMGDNDDGMGNSRWESQPVPARRKSTGNFSDDIPEVPDRDLSSVCSISVTSFLSGPQQAQATRRPSCHDLSPPGTPVSTNKGSIARANSSGFDLSPSSTVVSELTAGTGARSLLKALLARQVKTILEEEEQQGGGGNNVGGHHREDSGAKADRIPKRMTRSHSLTSLSDLLASSTAQRMNDESAAAQIHPYSGPERRRHHRRRADPGEEEEDPSPPVPDCRPRRKSSDSDLAPHPPARRTSNASGMASLQAALVGRMHDFSESESTSTYSSPSLVSQQPKRGEASAPLRVVG